MFAHPAIEIGENDILVWGGAFVITHHGSNQPIFLNYLRDSRNLMCVDDATFALTATALATTNDAFVIYMMDCTTGQRLPIAYGLFATKMPGQSKTMIMQVFGRRRMKEKPDQWWKEIYEASNASQVFVAQSGCLLSNQLLDKFNNTLKNIIVTEANRYFAHTERELVDVQVVTKPWAQQFCAQFWASVTNCHDWQHANNGEKALKAPILCVSCMIRPASLECGAEGCGGPEASYCGAACQQRHWLEEEHALVCSLSADKAAEILQHGSANGHILTARQRRYMAWKAYGKRQGKK
jgi:hypothetical protein